MAIDKLVSDSELRTLYGITASKRSRARWEAAGQFPRRVRVGGRACHAYFESEILSWIAGRSRERTLPDGQVIAAEEILAGEDRARAWIIVGAVVVWASRMSDQLAIALPGGAGVLRARARARDTVALVLDRGGGRDEFILTDPAWPPYTGELATAAAVDEFSEEAALLRVTSAALQAGALAPPGESYVSDALDAALETALALPKAEQKASRGPWAQPPAKITNTAVLRYRRLDCGRAA